LREFAGQEWRATLGRLVPQGETTAGRLSMGALRLERYHLELRAIAPALDQIKKNSEAATGAGRPPRFLERLNWKRVGAFRQPPADASVSRDLRGVAGLGEVGSPQAAGIIRFRDGRHIREAA